MSRRSEQLDEIRQILASMDSRLGQLSTRVDRVETRSRSPKSQNRRQEPFSEKGENESFVEGDYVFRGPDSNNINNDNNNNHNHTYNNNDHNNHNHNHNTQTNDQLGGNLKLTPPTFSGKVDPEGYLNWELRMNNLFENFNYPETKKVVIATAQFTEHALAWWDRELTEARRRGERPITSWYRLTERMRTICLYSTSNSNSKSNSNSSIFYSTLNSSLNTEFKSSVSLYLSLSIPFLASLSCVPTPLSLLTFKFEINSY